MYKKTYNFGNQSYTERKRADYTKVGFWYSDREPHFPLPVIGKPLEYKESIVKYLKDATVAIRWRGFSHCRICGCINGTTDLTDETYIWPSGLYHYVEKHNVELPKEFIEHILNNVQRNCN